MVISRGRAGFQGDWVYTAGQLGRGDAEAGASSPGAVFSQYRSIYSLEIKDLLSTGHFVLPGGVGREGAVWALLSLSFPAWGLHMTGQTPGFLHLSRSCWSPSALSRVPSTPVGRGKKYVQSTVLGRLVFSQPAFES